MSDPTYNHVCAIHSLTVSKVEAADIGCWSAVLVVVRACGSSIKDDRESRRTANVDSGVNMTLDVEHNIYMYTRQSITEP